MFKDKKVINFLKNNFLLLIVYLIVISLIIPVKKIGISYYTSKITTSLNNYSIINKCIMYILLIYIGTKILFIVKYSLKIILTNKLISIVRKSIFEDTLESVKKKYEEIEKGKIISYLNSIPLIYEDIFTELLSRLLPEGLSIIIFNIYF